nr:MAG TPA: minor tail protein [Caudoviricetes sp.]
MTRIQDYQVNYTINVEATEGVRQVKEFASAVKTLKDAKDSFVPAVNNINAMMRALDKTFRPKRRKRDSNFKLEVSTGESEKKLERIKALLTEIKGMTTGISLVINAGQALNSNQIKSQTKALFNNKHLEEQRGEIKKTASSSIKSVLDAQKSITKIIGKINAALINLEKGRQINIQTDVAKGRLQEILSLMRQIKGASKMTLRVQMNGPGKGMAVVPGASISTPIIANKAWERQQAKLQKAREAKILREAEIEQEKEYRRNVRAKLDAFNRMSREVRRRSDEIERFQVESALRKERKEEKKKREDEKRKQREASAHVNNVRRQVSASEKIQGNKQRAAINRLQYSKAPSLRNMPFAGMFSGYMAYSFMKSELSSAVEYANIMESARSILRVADTDLSTFEYRFEKMSQNIRNIGVDTKFSALEVGAAAKFLAMAGMDILTINEAMRPIANLALIGDNDISLIADLATNIMSGYNISNDSMNPVADILSSTVSRSNVSVVEMAESFKMAAGYLKLAGVDFSEASAAIGILGNSGIKATMAGTSLRAMSTRFAKPTKEATETLDRLGVKFTHFVDIYGKKVEKLRPLADIFKDLHDAGASMQDMISIFSKIGGNAAMQFVTNYDKLRVLTSYNRASHGTSQELANVQQNTTKGLWAQVTSSLTESFMQAYEIVEPTIRGILKDFLSKFSAPDMARGLASVGQALLNILSLLANMATWFTKNFYWIEPVLFSTFVATRLFKLAGAITNLGVAVGFLGKQSVASSTLQLITGLTGNNLSSRMLTFSNKRAIVSTLQAAGITGKGGMTKALLAAGAGGMGSIGAKSALSTLFSSQVATGTGLTGAAASISAIGTGAAVATASIAALVGALGWVAYKTWQIKKAKDAVQEEVNANEKYRYPSIEALRKSLRDTYTQALQTKDAIDNVTAEKTLEEESGQKIGMFTGNWWSGYLGMVGASFAKQIPTYTIADAYQDDTRAAILTIARKSGQEQINAAYAKLGQFSTATEISAFLDNIEENYKYDNTNLDRSLWSEHDGKVFYKKGIGKISAKQAAQTIDFANYQNTEVIKSIRTGAEAYRDAILTQESAISLLDESGFDFKDLKQKGYSLKDGVWQQKVLGKDATDDERKKLLSGQMTVHTRLLKLMGKLRETFGNSPQIAENIIKRAGFTKDLYSNEPNYSDDDPYNASRITTDSADDGLAGGNYSGTGKLSSAAPKQVIVSISNLLSVNTIDLMKSPEGQTAEIQNLKEQLAQALIDVVHDFDMTWNA